jgi:epidermal growth factor receptor substrate 15
MSGHITTVPASLPPELFSAASIASPATPQFGQSTMRRTDSVSSAGSGRAPPQVPPKIQQSPIRTDFTGGSQSSADGWDITPQDKTTFDNLFKGIDTMNKGYIDGIPVS